MKKLLFTVLVGAGLMSMAQAQSTDKGKWLVGGQVSYDFKNVKDVDGNQQNYAIVPQVGYFLSKDVAVGLGVGYKGSFQENAAGLQNTSDEFVLAPFGRYYKGNDHLKFFAQLAVPMAWGTAHVDDAKVGTTARYGAVLSPGIAYFPTSKVGIELSIKGLYFDSQTQEPQNGAKVTNNQFGLSADSYKPTLGVSFYF